MRIHVVLACLALVGCTESVSEAAAAPPEPAPQQGVTVPHWEPNGEKPGALTGIHDEALKYLRSDKEPKVKNATWVSPYVLKVSVVDDGTRRDDFAEYLCSALTDFKLPKPMIVSIVDVDKRRPTGDWIELGKKVCE